MKLAIDGGKPTRTNYLTFGKPEFKEEDIKEVLKCINSTWISTGPVANALEEKLKTKFGAKHAICLNSCTAGLHLSLLCNDIGVGDEVIVPSMTFAATVNVIEHVGAKPIFVDVDKKTLNIDQGKIESAITNKTKAIIAVHFAGRPCNMKKINAIAEKNKIIVIEDAAHAIGAVSNTGTVGNGINTTVFSFYATKNIAGGEGGAILTNNDQLAEKIRIYSLHGLSKNAWQRFSKEGLKTYGVLFPGYKYNMQDINASLIINQIDRLTKINEKRKQYSDIYDSLLYSNNFLEILPKEHDYFFQSSYHLYQIFLKLNKLTISRDEFIVALNAENIGCGIHYVGVHQQPYYSKKYGSIVLPNTENISARTISLPLQTTMEETDIHLIVDAINKITNYYMK